MKIGRKKARLEFGMYPLAATGALGKKERIKGILRYVKF